MHPILLENYENLLYYIKIKSREKPKENIEA